MISVENIKILKKDYYDSWQNIKDMESSLNKGLVETEDTKQGLKTISINKDDKKMYLHSKYNPTREAEMIIEEHKDNIQDNTIVLFYGLGMGYHIDTFVERYPYNRFYIYEPIKEICFEYLKNRELKLIYINKLIDIITGKEAESTEYLVNNVFGKLASRILIIELPSHTKIFKEEYNDFSQIVIGYLKNKKDSVGAEVYFQKRWTTNSMKNFKYVLNSPNILQKKSNFKDKSIVMVGAGPSLNEDIESIRYIKDNKLAYIFAVGSAINTLLVNDIYPDVACTYDPMTFNHNVYNRVVEEDIKDIPLIFGSSVGSELLPKYPGKIYHMITSQDSTSQYYLKSKDEEDIAIVSDASTIAIVTLNLANYLGFKNIIIAGQNLGYKNNRQHATGITHTGELTQAQKDESINVKDVYGKEMMTTEAFNLMRKEMEHYISGFEDKIVINTTKGGADIEGAKFMDMGKVIDEYLKTSIVEDNFLESSTDHYDTDYLKKQFKSMEMDYKRLDNIIKEYYNVLRDIQKSMENRNIVRLENLYIRLDKVFSKFESNLFVKIFILPMNRVDYRLLVDSIDNYNDESDRIKKANSVVNHFKSFLEKCKKDIEEVKDPYNEMRASIIEKLETVED